MPEEKGGGGGAADERLAGRGAVVTGASRGIGLLIARALARAGARVAMIARSVDALTAAAAAIENALPVPCDVTDPNAVRAAVADITTRWHAAPDILVNNAGIFVPRPLDLLTPKEFSDNVQVNLVSPFLLVHALLPGMRDQGRGHIVTIGSVADRTAFPENGAYSASKFGVRALHEVVRAELKGTGIRATLISPGPTDTSIWDDIDKAGTGRFPPRSEMLPADAVAEAVLYAVTQPARVNIDELRLSRA
jgi:NADP-dependent 3-hydroxy acid dehydrogenase YdfG